MFEIIAPWIHRPSFHHRDRDRRRVHNHSHVSGNLAHDRLLSRVALRLALHGSERNLRSRDGAGRSILTRHLHVRSVVPISAV